MFSTSTDVAVPADDDYSEVQVYFTPKEWSEMSDYEKRRLKNIKENYEKMLEAGMLKFTQVS